MAIGLQREKPIQVFRCLNERFCVCFFFFLIRPEGTTSIYDLMWIMWIKCVLESLENFFALFTCKSGKRKEIYHAGSLVFVLCIVFTSYPVGNILGQFVYAYLTTSVDNSSIDKKYAYAHLTTSVDDSSIDKKYASETMLFSSLSFRIIL